MDQKENSEKSENDNPDEEQLINNSEDNKEKSKILVSGSPFKKLPKSHLKSLMKDKSKNKKTKSD